MKLVTFARNGSTEPGALLDDKVIALKSAGFPTLLQLMQEDYRSAAARPEVDQ